MRFLIFVLLSFGVQDLSAQTEWNLKKEKDGIQAYTRKHEGSKFNEYKVETTLDATVEQMFALFKDFDSYMDIFPGTADFKVIHDEPAHHITYTKIKIPFPARDRDVLFDNQLSFDEDTKTLRMEVRCLTDEYETNPKLIQIRDCEGYWSFTDLGNNQVKVVNQLLLDPAGKAPAWIVNSKTVDDPIKTLKSIKERIQDEKYRGQSFTLPTK